MAQDPLHVLWVEPSFPGRLGAVADWLVRRRGYRSSFYCHTADPRANWPTSVGQGLDVQVFGVGGVARESAVTWSRALERSLCYSYGCWEVLEQRRPQSDRPHRRPVERSRLKLSSRRCTGQPRRWSTSWITTTMPISYDLADEAGPETAPAYFHWRRSMAAIDLLDLEQAALGWTPTEWQRDLYPAEYRDDIPGLHDGVDTPPFRILRLACHGRGPRSIAGRVIPDSTRVVTLRGQVGRPTSWFRPIPERRQRLATSPFRRAVVVVGDPIVRRGLDVVFHNRDYPAHLMAQHALSDADRLWFLGPSTPTTSLKCWPPVICTSPPAGLIRSPARCSRRWRPAVRHGVRHSAAP